MTNTELTLDQLTAITGGSTAIGYGTLTSMVAVSVIGTIQPTGVECKVPPSLKKPQDKVHPQFRIGEPPEPKLWLSMLG